MVSKDDIWAVGSYEQDQKEFAGAGKTLVLHWDGQSWTQVDSPNVQSWINRLSDIAVLSANDIWAVGSTNGGEHMDPLTMHWDGDKWSIVPSPASASHNGGSLSAVTALSETNIWAVGGDNFPTAYHWNGSRWEGFTLNNFDVSSKIYYGWLSDVIALSPTTIWAVGAAQDVTVSGNMPTFLSMRYGEVPCVTPSPSPVPTSMSTAKATQPASAAQTPQPVCRTWNLSDKSTGKSLVLHWDGISWNIVSSPTSNFGGYTNLLDVAAISAGDVWAAGSYGGAGGDESQGSYGQATYVIHWDGNRWAEVRAPNVGQSINVLTSLAFTSKDDVWAAGYFSNSSPTYSTLLLHWDGANWSVVPGPNIPHDIPALTTNKLLDLVALGKNDIWSLGQYDALTNGYSSYTFSMLQHWDGAQWNIMVPGTLSIGAKLTSIAAVRPDDVWALGPGLALAHWDGSTWDEVRKPDYYGQSTGSGKALALPSGEILILGQNSRGHIIIGKLVDTKQQCKISEIHLNVPPTPTFPPPVPTRIP